MADFAATLAQTLAQARANQDSGFSGYSRPSPRTIPDTYTAGLSEIGKSIGEGFNKGFEKSYLEPQARVAAETALMEQSPMIAAERGQQAWELLNKMDPTIAAKVIANPDFQRRAKLYNGVGLEAMFPQQADGTFTFSPATPSKAQSEGQFYNRAAGNVPGVNPTQGELKYFGAGPEAEVNLKNAQSTNFLAEAAKSRVMANEVLPGQSNLLRVQAEQLPSETESQNNLRAAQIAKIYDDILQTPSNQRIEEGKLSAALINANAALENARGNQELKKQVEVLRAIDNKQSSFDRAEANLQKAQKTITGKMQEDPLSNHIWALTKMGGLRTYLTGVRNLEPSQVGPTLDGTAILTHEYMNKVLSTLRGPLSSGDKTRVKAGLDEAITNLTEVKNQSIGMIEDTATIEPIATGELVSPRNRTDSQGRFTLNGKYKYHYLNSASSFTLLQQVEDTINTMQIMQQTGKGWEDAQKIAKGRRR